MYHVQPRPCPQVGPRRALPLPRLSRRFALALLYGLAILAVGADQFSYVPPTNLALELRPAGSWNPRGTTGFAARLIGRIGTPTAMVCYFETSPDLTVTPASATLPHLTANRPVDFRLQVGPGPGRAGAGGSWVRLRVVYRPDYGRQLQLAADPRRYPDPGERERLHRLIASQRQRNLQQTDAIRWFPPTADQE